MSPKLVGREVGSTGFGLMGLSWRENPAPKEKAIETMKAALNNGCTFWNGGEFYGGPEYNSLHILHDYFKKYPEDAEKVVICIKGGMVPGKMAVDGHEENVRRSIDECNKVLAGTKTLDMFEMGRQDPNVPIEETIGAIDKLVKEGKLSGVSLSELSAKSIRRAAKVAKIESVEVEFSLFETSVLENGVAQACAELNIPLVAYSPLGRGFLTGQFKTYEDIEKLDDMRKHFPRFQKENFDQNIKLADAVEEIAKKKGCSSPQIALAWVKSHSGKGGLPTIIPIPGATTVDRVNENSKDVSITDAEMKELDEVLKSCLVVGGRYPDHIKHLSDGLA